MTSREIQIRLGIFFTTINVTALALGGLTAARTNILAGIAVFFTTVILFSFLVEKKAWYKLEEQKNGQETNGTENRLFNI